MRVVIDTSVVLSGLAYPASVPGQVMQLWHSGALQAVLSEYLLDEIERLLPKMTARLKWSAAERHDYIELLRFQCDLVEPVAIKAVRDKNDDPILGTLIAAQAEYLITGDKDLLALSEKYPIVTLAQFLARHGAR